MAQVQTGFPQARSVQVNPVTNTASFAGLQVIDTTDKIENEYQ